MENIEYYVDANNQCWLIITEYIGVGNKLVKCNTSTGKLTDISDLPPVITENNFLSIVAGKICVVTENDLRFYDTVLNSHTEFSKEKLGSNDILLMALPDINHKNVLWIATKGSGIIRFNIETQEVTHYTEINGLPNNTVYYMARDKQGFLWCSSNTNA